MRKPYWVSSDGRHKLFHAESRDFLTRYGWLGADALVSDPPYGIGYEASRYTANNTNETFSGVIEGDSEEFDPSYFMGFGKPMILWGGNNFAQRLSPGGWLCWDKRTSEQADKMFGSPFEMAWCSDRSKFKMLRCQHGGVVNADGHGIKRVHPTQKPIRVMEWCLTDVLRLAPNSVVLDPYCGSGTTGVACVRICHRFIGVEIEEKYCEVAAKRIEAAIAAPPLFTNI